LSASRFLDPCRIGLPFVLILASTAHEAQAQGCILIRESAPIIGAPSSTYLRPGEWQLDLSYRDSTADRHYVLDVFQEKRTALGTNVINKQKLTVVNIDHAVTRRFSFGITVPFVVSSWSIPSPPTTRPGPRATQHGQGLGDISAIGRYWMFDTLTHPTRNVAIGVGVKTPTGGSDITDTFPDIAGANRAVKAVDQSVQPGDGGWGVRLEAQGYTRAGPAFVFGSANYLVSPEDTNGTPSILIGLGRPSRTVPMRNINSVTDQYVARVGTGIAVWRRFGASVAWRVEGVPRYDLVGRSDGFRRPGFEMFVEPGITYTTGQSTIQLTVPKGFYRFRAPDPYTGVDGDATFPDWIVIGSYSYRFGTVKHVSLH
jgi:hypothetical protein